MERLTGIGASKGYAIGKIEFLKNSDYEVKRTLVDNVPFELKRFEDAQKTAIGKQHELYAKAKEDIGESEAQIFEIHAMMLEDLDYVETIKDKITNESVASEWAIEETSKLFAKMFSGMEDDYMRERASDVLDISRSLIQALRGEIIENDNDIKTPIIIASLDLMPSDTVSLDRERVLAFVTREGSTISHSAILARTMGIPSVVALGTDYDKLLEGDTVIIDGFTGEVYREPTQEVFEQYHSLRKEFQKRQQLLQELKGKESVTKDGVHIEVNANIGNLNDLRAVKENDAEGIGLFRSEFIYLESKDYPTEDEQFEIYRSVLEEMGNKRVIVRTLDLGADKQADYFNIPKEDNPAMGCRAIRICFERPDVFRTQLRALYRASVYGNLAIMIPMIISLSEVRKVKRMAAAVREELEKESIPYSANVPLGIMIETPSAAVISDVLAKEVDFFSVGTNDLTQYTLAADRMNSSIAHLYNSRHPAVLRLLAMTAQNGEKSGIWTGICGESASDLSLIPLYLAMGVRELSVSPGAVLEVREAVRNINLKQTRKELLDTLEEDGVYELQSSEVL